MKKRKKVKKAHYGELVKASSSVRREVVKMLTEDGLVKNKDNLGGNVTIFGVGKIATLEGQIKTERARIADDIGISLETSAG